jgi:hypothetical protein
MPVAFAEPHPNKGIVYINTPRPLGLPVMVMVRVTTLKTAVQPIGKPIGDPIPVAIVVECVILGKRADDPMESPRQSVGE